MPTFEELLEKLDFSLQQNDFDNRFYILDNNFQTVMSPYFEQEEEAKSWLRQIYRIIH
jgi:hypothetical protein